MKKYKGFLKIFLLAHGILQYSWCPICTYTFKKCNHKKCLKIITYLTWLYLDITALLLGMLPFCYTEAFLKVGTYWSSSILYNMIS